ncbi:unnamed protein product [Pylaiella littoralis]
MGRTIRAAAGASVGSSVGSSVGASAGGASRNALTAAAGSPATETTPTREPSTPEQPSPVTRDSFLARWSPVKEESKVKTPFSPSVFCNRPGCCQELWHLILPGTKQNGVTFACCSDELCAGGGSILAYQTDCVACNGKIPERTICLSLEIGNRKYQNQHRRNCLLDKVPGTEDAAFACKAALKDIGKDCTTCVQPNKVIKAGDILLSSAPLGTRLHYACARRKRKDYLRVVFDIQNKRHAENRAKNGDASSKKTKVEETVGYACLAPDSDNEL